MITLDPNFVGKVDRTSKEVLEKEARETAREAANTSETVDVTKRARGKNSSLRRYLRKKQKNVIDQQKVGIDLDYLRINMMPSIKLSMALKCGRWFCFQSPIARY